MYISSTFIKLANLYISALFFHTHLRFRGVSKSRSYRVIRRLAYAMGHLVACAALLATDARALHAGPPSSNRASRLALKPLRPCGFSAYQQYGRKSSIWSFFRNTKPF